MADLENICGVYGTKWMAKWVKRAREPKRLKTLLYLWFEIFENVWYRLSVDTVKSLEKCEVYDETNGGSGHDPKLYILNFYELLCILQNIYLCAWKVTLVLYCLMKVLKYLCNKLYLCEKYYLKCDVDARLALWANEANMHYMMQCYMIFVMGELVFPLILSWYLFILVYLHLKCTVM